ncbi:MAG: hypothetical protein R6X08_08970 [Desulfosalsimonadaceae bacterium]
MELPDSHIHYQCQDHKGDDPEKKMGLPEQDEVPKGAHRTKPAALGDKTDEEPDKKTSAPIMAKTPRTKRTIGAEPPRGRNSRNIKAAASDPRMKPMISGRRYCTTPARCSPIAPAMSLSKQATHMPMLPGFPQY